MRDLKWSLIRKKLIQINTSWLISSIIYTEWRMLCFYLSLRHNERVCDSNHRVPIVCSTVYSGADQRKKSKLSVTGLCEGIHLWLVDSVTKDQWRCKCFHSMTSSWFASMSLWLWRKTERTYFHEIFRICPTCYKEQSGTVWGRLFQAWLDCLMFIKLGAVELFYESP